MKSAYSTTLIIALIFANHSLLVNGKNGKNGPSPWKNDLNDKLLGFKRRLQPGSVHSRIVGGKEAQVGRYPYIVTLLFGDFPFCGGTLIDPEWVLTAAHCAGVASQILIGHHDQNNVPESAEKIKISYEVPHPSYDESTLANDIMLVKLVTPSSFPVVRLYKENGEIPEGTDVNVMGWGHTTQGGKASDVLLEAEIQIVSNQNCDTKYGWQTDITDVMMCAAADGKDSCQGDSGGPLIIKGANPSLDVQIGIVSWGFGCADPKYPGVYATVANQQQFIEDTMRYSTGFPDDGFDYSQCDASAPIELGNDICDVANNSTECNNDGGDCGWCPFPEDDFDYSQCTAYACLIGDGVCQAEALTAECNFDGGDCEAGCIPDDGFDYSNCNAPYLCWLNDDVCDGGEYDTPECNYDGGDCKDVSAPTTKPTTSPTSEPNNDSEFPDDGFDYSNCNVQFPSWINDGLCDGGEYDTPQCNDDGGDCKRDPTSPPTTDPNGDSEFPNDGFDYSNCNVQYPSWIKDNYCDGGEYDTPQCNHDGGDCKRNDDSPTAEPTSSPTKKTTSAPTAKPTAKPTSSPTTKPTSSPTTKPTSSLTAKPTSSSTAVPTSGDGDGSSDGFPNDGFDYSKCSVTSPNWIADGYCDGMEYNTADCNYDGGDCETPDDGFDYSNCDVSFPSWIGDGQCDGVEYNVPECAYDGGDCDSTNSEFPNDGFDYSECTVNFPSWIGDGECDGISYNVAECNFDGGDCDGSRRILTILESYFGLSD